MGAESLYEERYVGLEEMLLLTQCFLRKSMGKQTAVSRMVGVVSAQDRVDAVVGWCHPERVFGEVEVALMVIIYVMPGPTIYEGELIGRQSDNRTISLVNFMGPLGEIALD